MIAVNGLIWAGRHSSKARLARHGNGELGGLERLGLGGCRRGYLAASRILIASVITSRAHTSKTAAAVNELAIACVRTSCA
jgi:hypothetical protein